MTMHTDLIKTATSTLDGARMVDGFGVDYRDLKPLDTLEDVLNALKESDKKTAQLPTLQEVADAVKVAEKAAHGDSNDEEIEALQEALALLKTIADAGVLR